MRYICRHQRPCSTRKEILPLWSPATTMCPALYAGYLPPP